MSKITKVVVVGGGTAGWLTAALLKKVLGSTIELALVESREIGTVGVGEATIPPIRLLNSVLGLDEGEFLRETKATIKLAIRFDNWRVPGEGYFHTFGEPGRATAFGRFHDYWVRARQLGNTSSLWDYDLNYLAATALKFAKLQTQDPALDIPYAYHFDASLYAKFLHSLSEKMGVYRREGKIESVVLDPDNGYVKTLRMHNGETISGDLFIDCSGFRALLIQQQLDVGYEDWGHWLPCDRAMAVPSQRFSQTLLYTRSIAHTAGWQWRIPLQHRNGNGLVYSSAYYSDDEAATRLLSNLESEPLDDPKILSFRTGRRRKQWHRNVIAVGLSSGFLEPLESTSIHLIQSAVVRLLKLFPHHGINAPDVDEYNRQSKIEFEQIRDFIILHYHVNAREDSQFWRELRQMDIPESLSHKIALFKSSGKIFRESDDLFFESSWVQVLIGQGIIPQDYHPIADLMSRDELEKMLAHMRQLKARPLEKLPNHDDFLRHVCAGTHG